MMMKLGKQLRYARYTVNMSFIYFQQLLLDCFAESLTSSS
jgi:hypothetical protein